MLFLLSPAKSLDYETPVGDITHTMPLFTQQSARLIQVLKTQTPQQIAHLMDLSDSLAALNVGRYQAFSTRFTAKNSKQAVLAFDGDVYDGLQAKTLSHSQLEWAQNHLCILSGLYGILRPLDRMQPYRLEMGTRLVTEAASNLYQFWGRQIADYLNQRAQQDTSPVVVNLASQEYFKAVDLKVLRARVIECVFEDYKNGQYKVISFFAKRARGLMARYAITHQVATPKTLEAFQADGYRFDGAASRPERLVFRRRLQP
jgi:uncharacterized protein